ncbi:MAG: hypothetical protein A3I00_03085 [Betaproteobacteria bacterium RIFCSPLOWO2_02_FULL_64_12]|nr:MAG: hypothetical protein A3I00_03085 [Betaproteobacteria bacterium RIFCSPLOWO2_02_FULL_64_12]OGA73836.1 MAG: hypothetical protein A3G27_10735 [Betaproteobacteria bacterium RIFCSPLOWO2_12_FULL_66_14]
MERPRWIDCARLAPALLPVLSCFVLLSSAPAQEPARTLLLVAKPGLPDPNFRESVVVVTQDSSAGTVGVIINRPTDRSLASILPGERFKRFTEPVFFGGPVASNGLFAVFRAEKSPGDAVRLLPGLFLTLNPGTVDELVSRPPGTIRFFTGYSGWAPGQLDGEVLRGDWYVLDPDSETVFRKDMKNLWQDLVRRASSIRAGLPAATVD